MRAPTRCRWFAAGFIAFLLATSATGQDDELARIREEAKGLRQALERLEARIRALESRDPAAGRNDTQLQIPRGETQPAPAAPNAGPASASPGYSRNIEALASLKDGWSQVVPGLPEDRVEALLGKPEKVLRIDNTPVWYYVYPDIGRGSVFFNASGKVSSRQAPAMGW